MKVVVITSSDSVARGQRQDASGPAVVARCQELGWDVTATHLVADDPVRIQALLGNLADQTGPTHHHRTGLGPRDCTPGSHAGSRTKLIPVCRANAAQRAAALAAGHSFAVSPPYAATLILNLPGSEGRKSLDAVAGLLPHSIRVKAGAATRSYAANSVAIEWQGNHAFEGLMHVMNQYIDTPWSGTRANVSANPSICGVGMVLGGSPIGAVGFCMW